MSKKTPQKSSKEDRDCSILLSPHHSRVAVSPGRSPLTGQLTGSARKVKDTCADWHNAILKWNQLNSRGMRIITEISNRKITSSESKNEETDATTWPEGLQKLCDDLTDIYQSLASVVDKMVKCTSAMKGIANLEWHQENQSFCEEPLFQTWSINLFGETSEELLKSYQKELAVKKAIVEHVAHSPSREILVFYSATWIHQAYITDKETLLLESMLTETGHR
ncbi:hypothetical protein CAPTEDRAFT_224032 [Capitella teleta]|uniref:Cyclin-dependent kinase 2-interacting protein n=1 Tax=Capitella teleta TaxID=283909 RepID=R7V115_CAPTE|nr:hypothetical protein CAPTEDRAFT_224032 [Capitella teleta]|eukprot:ELU12543.1 hypothetical protein CAPTEDRAFT_224032 [Capitella teleta]